jgi:23S rRNA (guanosine2251-2'-O)-methyltransferase
MAYQEKKAYFQQMLTIYGRKAVEEALMDKTLPCYKLHLADSNKPAGIIQHCITLAEQRSITIEYHDKRKLSFISKNAKQDQGIALDIKLDNLCSLQDIQARKAKHLLLLDNVTNPQNVGMIIRSVAAGFIDGVIIPEKGCAELGPLVIKASVGSIFNAPIYRCNNTLEAIDALQNTHQFAGLSLDTSNDFYAHNFNKPTVFILGNETKGIANDIAQRCNVQLKIPMRNKVESLNVAITAALIAFHPALRE